MGDTLDATRQSRIGKRLIIFTGTILAISSGVKFLHPAKAVGYMTFLGYSDEKLFLIAAMELAIAILFLYRTTRVAGVLLVSAYFGGAIAAHLADHPLTSNAPIVVFNFHHHYLGTLPAVIVLVCAWVGIWLHHPQLFQAGRTERGSAGRSEPARSQRAVPAAAVRA
ncbi:MAG TPA: DoxX family protein [Vicinamibacterales bacterium]|jgi:hypothetical protein|nr:DoxX family protein [Vicinamibacterales bacterium]